MFIERFWERRIRTPAIRRTTHTRTKHYRRIAYASRRFGTATLPGWKADRGMVYILYGPPDEIESHPRELREEWLYHFVAGVGSKITFEFRDGKLVVR